MREEKYDKALRLLENDDIKQAYQKGILNPEILLLKAICIQLSENSLCSLSDTQKILEDAIKLDDKCIPAYIELEYFLDAVMAKSGDAEPYFKKAFDLNNKNRQEILTGLVEMLMERKGSGNYKKHKTKLVSLLKNHQKKELKITRQA
jgi:hypothetical protein